MARDADYMEDSWLILSKILQFRLQGISGRAIIEPRDHQARRLIAFRAGSNLAA